MRKVFLILCEVGAVVPLALTELCALIMLGTMGASPHGGIVNASGSLAIWAIAAVSFGTAGVYFFFRRLWAQCFAGVVSLFWFFIGCQMLLDAQFEPAKFEFGSRADVVMILISLGAIGSASFVVMYLLRWFLPQREPGGGDPPR